jgi:hypothetical protein
MRKKMVFCMMMVLAVSTVSLAVDAHWQPAADPNRPAGEPALWTVAENWSTGIVPNAADQVLWIATANSAPCLLDGGTWQINQIKLGEGSDGSNNGHLIVKGVINTADNWQGIGAWGGNIGVLEVDGGQFNSMGGAHMWCGNQGDGTLIIKNGGQINIGVGGGGAQLGLGWDGTTGVGRAFIYDGILTVNNWTTGSIHPNTPSFIDIEHGSLSIAGYRFSPNDGSGTAVDVCAQDGRIRGFSSASFDKKINIDNVGTNNENDVINNVLLSWDGSRTVVTAIHPQQPAPYFNDVLVTGDIEFGWNNWDPNQPGDSVFAELWVGTDPNKLGDDYELVTTLDVTGVQRSTFVKNLAPGIYYWQVDTTNGPGSFHEGDVFWFEVVSYKAPILTGGQSVVTTLDLLPATLSASVTTYGTPLSSVDFTLLNDDMEFPVGANAVLSNTTVDLQNPTAELTTDMAGTYTILLTVSDDTTTLEKLIEVDVYADACQAKKDSPSGWTANYYDRNGDCFVTIHDFAIFAEAWLTDTTMKAQETQARDVDYFQRSIFDARIEGESVDPDAVSDAPVTDETGVRIVGEGGATGGGQALGWTGTNAYAEYELTIPAAGTYDVYLSTAAPNGNAVLSFGDGTTADLYGSADSIPGLGWGNYSISKHEGALFFPAAGAYTVRITWTNEANLDWFSLVQQ